MMVSIVNECRLSPFGDCHEDQSPAMPMGAPSARMIRVEIAWPDRQSGSKMASAGMMQRCSRFHASRKLCFTATVYDLALNVDRAILVSADQSGTNPKSPFKASAAGTASSPTSACGWRRTKVPMYPGHRSRFPDSGGGSTPKCLRNFSASLTCW